MQKRKLFILLTRFPDFGSKAVNLLTGFYYTHASIGLEEDMNTFYSFVCKGFVVEKITRYVKPDKEPFPCRLYELEVPENVYNSAKKLLNLYAHNKSSLHYTKMGVFLSLLHIPYKRRYHYFCSHFVAEILKHIRAVPLKKDCSLYMPGDFSKLPGVRLTFYGNLQSMISHYGLTPSFS